MVVLSSVGVLSDSRCTPRVDQGPMLRDVDLMGLKEIAELLDVSIQRAHQLAATDGFPAPLGETSAGRVWKRVDVEKWARADGRLPKK